MNRVASTRPLRRASRAARRRARIGLTPLIDVVFILLIFFMLASSFLDWRSIELAAPMEAAVGTVERPVAVVALAAGGAVQLDGERVTLDALEANVKARVSSEPELRVVVTAEAGVPLQATVAALDRIAAAGAADVSLVRGDAG